MSNNMNPLYPTMDPKHPPTTSGIGSFDDYDSIIDGGFSMGDNESDDVSSMHMSEMGGVSVLMAGSNPNSPARSARSSGKGGSRFGSSPGRASNSLDVRRTTVKASNAVAAAGYGDVNDSGEGGAQFLPPSLQVAAITSGVPHEPDSPQRSTSTNSSFKKEFYHVGDIEGDLGIDATDVSAILGPAESTDPLDCSLLAGPQPSGDALDDIDGNINGQFEDQHSLPPADEVRNNLVLDGGNDNAARPGSDFHDVENGMSKKQLGPLGDELSYAEENNNNPQMIYDENYDYDSDDDSEAENDGILPNWISFSSRRTKFIFVASSALILGSLVLAIVALGVSYGNGGLDGSNSGDDANIDRASGGVVPGAPPAGAAPPETLPVPVPVLTSVPTKSPSNSPMIAVVPGADETTGEGVDLTSPPTGNPTTGMPSLGPTPNTTIQHTATMDVVDMTTPTPTVSPREVEIAEADILSTTAPTSSPTAQPPTSLQPTKSPFETPSIKPSLASSEWPSNAKSDTPSLRPTKFTYEPSLSPSTNPSSNPTVSSAPTDSAKPTNTHSDAPTLSLDPSAQPSLSPTYAPSLVPSVSSKPSWSFGDVATEDGDATFFLMADGGSNFQFWTEKMKNLVVEEHFALIHLGSATRAVDNCDNIAYYRTQLSLSGSPVPVYSLPGNNDYPACPSPLEGWTSYKDHMMNIDTMYWNATKDYDLKRHDTRAENFSFLYKRVLFVGLNTVTNSNADETFQRMEDNINWVVSNVDAYKSNADVIFLMGYGRLLASELETFYDAMKAKKESEWEDKLLVYARRGASSELVKDINGIEGFVELRVGNEWPIMDVRVRTKGPEPRVDYRMAVEEEEDEKGGGGKDKNP